MSQRQNRVDLHLHSTASDGLFTPSEVVRLALERGLSVIALTDHDTLDGVAEARQAAVGTGLEVITGVEVNSEGDWGDLHFLGYYVDPDNGPLRERLQAMRDARVGRARKMVERLREMGMRRVLGPFNLSINHECGLLVEGFDTPPMVMMGHACPYYAERLEEQDYFKEKDLLAYRLGTDFMIPAVIQAMGKMAGRVHIRPLRKSRLENDLQIIRDIFEDAWSQNWCFIPFTESEFKDLGRNLMFLVDKNFVQIAEVDGAPTAMIVAFPNLNEIIRDLNGRLLPVGWFKLLWRLKITYPKTGRAVLMGIRKRYQHSLLGAVLAFMVIDAVRVAGVKRGIQEVELSWILEDNTRMRNMLESLGAEAYKRYRIYQKKLK